MKKKMRFLTLLLFVFMLTVLVSCGDKNSDDEDLVMENFHFVLFNSDGGSDVLPLRVLEGERAIAPSSPTKENNNFIGWYLDDEEFDFNTPIVKETTLIAKWQEIASVVDLEGVVGDTIELSSENDDIKEYESSDLSVATVDSDGVVTLLKEGSVIIKATSTFKIETYNIIVLDLTVAVEEIIIHEEEEIKEVSDVYTITYEVLPSDATNKDVLWTSSDDDIATVVDGTVTFKKAGTVTIKVSQGNISDEFTFTVYEEIVAVSNIIIEADASDGVIGDVLNIIARIEPTNATFQDLTWSSSDIDIATISDGKVTLLAEGKVTITATSKDVNKTYQISSYEPLDYIWNKFRDTRKATVTKQSITQYGGTTVVNDLFPSIYRYRFNDDLFIDRKHFLPEGHPSHPNIDVKQEWIVVHDTGNINSDAEAHAMALKNQEATSWQYVVGNDGIFQTLEDTKVSWHASAGSTRAGFTDTGIPAVNPFLRPKFTIIDGYLAIKGIKTNVIAPNRGDGEAKFVLTGLWPVIMDGTYWVPDVSSRSESNVEAYLDYHIVLDGGNYEGIGIETSVFQGGDLWITWHRTAKLVAHLLVKHDLAFDRVVFHNSFNNKTCPQTAIRSGNIDNWLDLMAFEYMILTKFSDYSFSFTPINSTFIDDTGRVIGNPLVGNFFDYTLKITDPLGNFKEQTFRTRVA